MSRRPPPAPSTGRKPQTGMRREAPVVGPHLNYLAWLQAQGPALAELVQQEAQRKPAPDARRTSFVGNLLTGPVSLEPGKDPLLHLDADALRRLDPTDAVAFDPARPAVAVSLEFLGARRDLPRLGVVPVAQAGDLFVGWVNLDKLKELIDHPCLVYVEASRSVVPTVDPGGGEPGDPHFSSTTHANATGRGVRLAVIDLGFDFLHPALVRDAGGAQQVRALWLHDMKLKRPDAPADQLGLRLTHAELQDALDWYNSDTQAPPGPQAVQTHLQRLGTSTANQDFRDLLQQHGTAVSGIAAGNGRGGDPAIPAKVGVAPEADLALIAIGGHDETRFANSVEVCTAFQAAFEDTTAPCVALMANSDNLGPHDGSLHGERFLDELLLQPGRAVVLTAGNLNHVASPGPGEGIWHAVAQQNAESGPPLPLVLRYDSTTVAAVAADTVEVWFRPPANVDATATIGVKLPGGTALTPVIVPRTTRPVPILDPNAPGNPNRTTVNAQLQRDDYADAYCLQLVFLPSDRPIVDSEWTIHVTAEGPVHGWLDRNNEFAGRWQGLPAQAGADFATLGSPASATRPLTVGAVASAAGNAPHRLSGRGPRRAPPTGPRKPDLVAVGENVVAPLGQPHTRMVHARPSEPDYKLCIPAGTSYAAPQVAGACALLFERFGPAATWADIRQAILQATVRTGDMPRPEEPEASGWDRACGYGMLDLPSLLSPPMPATADLWLPKASADTGTEPFVAETFWDSPVLVLEDAAGLALDPAAVAAGTAVPARLRVRVANRGTRAARDVKLTAWWAPLGAAYPLPQPDTGGGAWRAEGFGGQAGNLQHVAEIAAGAMVERAFAWAPPRDAQGRVSPHLLLATVGADDDPYDPGDTPCAQNNVALLAVAVVRDGMARFQILGSDDTDGLIVWCKDARIQIRDLPITAVPWRDAGIFAAAKRRSRPLYGAADVLEDVALGLSTTLEGSANVAAITDVVDADRITAANGHVTIEGGARLTLPRLRIQQGTTLEIQVAAAGQPGRAIHLLHLSGGRRVGGGSAQFSN